MLFEALRDGRVIMHTDEADCIDPPDVLLSMQTAGYTFRMDGQTWEPGVQRTVKREKPLKRGFIPGKRIPELDGAVQLTL